jgi:non-homologous end joining protein Ku
MVDLAAHLLDTKASKFNPDKFKGRQEGGSPEKTSGSR